MAMGFAAGGPRFVGAAAAPMAFQGIFTKGIHPLFADGRGRIKTLIAEGRLRER